MLQSLLHQTVMQLLKCKDTRDPVLNWIANVLNGNQGRTKLQLDRFTTSSEGFILNLGAILLKLCAPFTDGIRPQKVNMPFCRAYLRQSKHPLWFLVSSVFQIKMIGSTFCADSKLLDLSKETRVSASSDEISAWIAARVKETPSRGQIEDSEKETINDIGPVNPSENDNISSEEKGKDKDTHRSEQPADGIKLTKKNLGISSLQEHVFKSFLIQDLDTIL